MKCLLIAFILFTTGLQAQVPLTFDHRFVECEDHWVAFQQAKDSTYAYGFIYIDAQAGLTLNYEGKFAISPNGRFVPKKLDSVGMKYRLQPNQVKVAIIPASKFQELQITGRPEWLKFYETDTASVARLYRWGFLYNSWGESAKALTYLERAQKIDARFKGLAFELGFAYNALQQYDKAITVLESAVAAAPNDCYGYKELSFAQLNLGQLDQASATCKKGIAICTDKALKCEIAYNLTYKYFAAKDKTNFAWWAGETKKWANPGDQFSTNISKMEASIGK